jgi:hypothetical protein
MITRIKLLITTIIFGLTFPVLAQLPGPFWKQTNQSPTILEGEGNISITCNVFNDNLFVGTIKSGIFRSANNGDSWQNVLLLQDTAVVKVLVSGGIIYAIADHYVFQSNNNGSTWSRFNVPTTFPLTDIEVHNGTIIVSAAAIIEISPSEWDYAGDGIFISSDQGVTWTQKINGLPHRKGITHLAVNSTGVLYSAMSSFDGLGGGLYYSLDAGNTWIAAAKPAYSTPKNSTQATIVHDVFCLEVDKHDSIYYSFEGIAVNVLVSAGLKNSLNNINGSWLPVRLTLNGYDWQFKPFYSIYFVKGGSDLYASLNTINSTIQGGPYFYPQGSSWKRIVSGMFPVNNSYLKVNYAEDSQARIYAIQMTDHRVYIADTTEIQLLSMEENHKSHVRIFPNPAKEVLHIVLEDGQACKGYYLTDLYGKSIQSNSIFHDHGLTVPVMNLPAGVYFIHFQSSEGVITHKMIKTDF